MKTLYRRIISVLLALMMTACFAGTVLAEEAPEGGAEEPAAVLDEITVTETFGEETSEEIVPSDPEVPAVTEEPVVTEEPIVTEEPTTPEEPEVYEEVIISEEVVVEENHPVPEIVPAPEEIVPLVEEVISDTEEIDEIIYDETTILSISSDLVKGMYSSEVYKLQLRLEQLGYLTPNQADSYFGIYTESAVKLLQAENGLYVDGVVGNYTVNAINYSAVPFYNLTKGMYNSAVTLMQQALIDKGYLVASPADGDFGNVTYNALRLFQAANGLSATGVGDISTLTVLLTGSGSANTFRTLQMGSQGSDVASVQAQLEKLGFYTGGVDGGFGAMSQASVSLFQAFNGWSAPNGIVDSSTYLSLFGSCNSFSVLSKGATGNAVTVIQKYLQDMEFLTSVTGTFDDATVEALKKFQKANNLTQDGIPSSQTLQKLFNFNAAGAVEFQLSVGSTGDRVYKLQEKLSQLGFMIGLPDGYYGSVTYAAVCAYQAQMGNYYPTGVVNAALYKQIMASSEYFAELYWGCPYWSAVYGMQNILANHQMMNGPDGDFGYYTEVCVLQIQKMFGLAQTGVANAETLYYIYTFDSHLQNRYNVQGYYSSTGWLIFINTTMNRFYVYQGSWGNWSLVYNWACSTGRPADPSPLGEYTTTYRLYTFSDNETYSVYYTTNLYYGYFMHSVLYKPYTWIDEDTRLGLNLSHGCIRLDTNNAIWVYNNIPLGTKVVLVK